MPYIDAPWDVLKKKYALYNRDFFLAEMNVDDNGTPEVSDDRPAEDFYITFDTNACEPYTIRRKNEDELNFNLTFGFKPGGDPKGLDWRIKRDGGMFAYAIPSKANDTFDALAKKLRLDFMDYDKWAHTSDLRPQICKKYKIPNLVVYDRGGRKFVDCLPLNVISVCPLNLKCQNFSNLSCVCV